MPMVVCMVVRLGSDTGFSSVNSAFTGASCQQQIHDTQPMFAPLPD